MPRTGKGGKREGSNQTSYANRTDLNNRGPEPITAAPGEPYGQRQMLEDAQRAVPMAGTQTPAPVPTTPQNASQAPMVTQQRPPLPEPGTIPFLHPTQRPDEPVTAGTHPIYNEVPLQMSNHPHVHLAAALDNAAADPAASPLVQQLAEMVRGSLL